MGPLQGLRIIEIEGMGPAPFCGMMLADMGAEVISVSRKSGAYSVTPATAISERGKKSIALNLKHPQGVQTLLTLCESADALIEGFRPGVMERLGLGPDECLAKNPALVYGRMTGWGQTGPLAQAAGHDINYISLSGALHAMGRAGEKPVPPLNLVGDFGGGGMFLAFGVVCAILEAGKSGKGQVLDVSMVEGSAVLMQMMYAYLAGKTWVDQRGVNLLDGGAYFYDSYETLDGKYIAIGAIEPQFYQRLMELAELDENTFGKQWDLEQWPLMREKLVEIFKRKTREQWCELMEGSDVCFAPVLSMNEAPQHPHNRERQSFITINGVTQPAPAPKFSRTPAQVQHPAPFPGADTDAVLAQHGYSTTQITQMRADGVLT